MIVPGTSLSDTSKRLSRREYNFAFKFSPRGSSSQSYPLWVLLPPWGSVRIVNKCVFEWARTRLLRSFILSGYLPFTSETSSWTSSIGRFFVVGRNSFSIHREPCCSSAFARTRSGATSVVHYIALRAGSAARCWRLLGLASHRSPPRPWSCGGGRLDPQQSQTHCDPSTLVAWGWWFPCSWQRVLASARRESAGLAARGRGT